MSVGDQPSLVVEIVAEQVAVEIRSELRKEAIERSFCAGSGANCQNVTEMGCALDAEICQVGFYDHPAVKEIAGKNQPAQKPVEDGRFHIRLGVPGQRVPRIPQIVEQVPIDALGGIERPAVIAEEGASLDRDEKFTKRAGDTIDLSHKARQLDVRLVLRRWARHAGMNLDRISGDQHQDRGAAVIPEFLVQPPNLIGGKRFDPFEINERRAFGA